MTKKGVSDKALFRALCKIYEREEYVGGDWDMEWEHTTKLLNKVRRLCIANGVGFSKFLQYVSRAGMHMRYTHIVSARGNYSTGSSHLNRTTKVGFGIMTVHFE